MLLVTANGEEHGLINTMPNSVPDDDFKNFDPSLKEEMKKLKKEDAKKVSARFINHQYPDEPLTKRYCKYAGDPIQEWKFLPGHEYTVPYGLVKEVNESRQMERQGLQSVDGKEVNKGEMPLEKDRSRPLYELVPTKF